VEAEIKGTILQVLEMKLNPGDKLVAEAGELSWMTQPIKLTTTTQTGGAKGMMGVLKRAVGGGGFFMTEYEAQGRKLSKTKTELLSNYNFQELMTRLRVLVDNPNTVGHPKLDRAANMIIEHFIKMDDQNQDTRVMVFAQYRSSAAELVKQLRRQEPLVKPTIFVGQAADTRGAAGMKQSEQLEVLFI
jgi:hypothetical protein